MVGVSQGFRFEGSVHCCVCAFDFFGICADFKLGVQIGWGVLRVSVLGWCRARGAGVFS